nr:hypothetical protein [Mycobacterium sp. KBS0706]
MIALECPVTIPQLAPRRLGKSPQDFRGDRGADPVDEGGYAVCIGPRLITDRSQLRQSVLECRVAQVGDAAFDRLVEALQLRFCFRCPLSQLSNVAPAALDPFLTPLQKVSQDLVETAGIEQPPFQMIDHHVVELVHPHALASAAPLALASRRRAGVVAILVVLAGAQRHRPAANSTKADAGQQGRTADQTRCPPLWAARPQVLLDCIELLLGHDRRNRDLNDLVLRLWRPGLEVELVEAVPTDIARIGEDLVDRCDAPAAAVAGTDAALIEMGGDRLDPHRTALTIPLEGQSEDQAHGFGMDGIDLELLLDLLPALLGGDDAVADRRPGTVPIALARILLHRPQGVLAVLLRLVLIEERHDLPDHIAHWIVAELLGDRDEADVVLDELPDIELELELVPEEAREGVDDDDVEGRRLGARGIDKALELRAPVVRR